MISYCYPNVQPMDLHPSYGGIPSESWLAPGLAPAGGESRGGGEASRTRRPVAPWPGLGRWPEMVNSHIAMEIHHFEGENINIYQLFNDWAMASIAMLVITRGYWMIDMVIDRHVMI